jgi:hypothetical protein
MDKRKNDFFSFFANVKNEISLLLSLRRFTLNVTKKSCSGAQVRSSGYRTRLTI